MITTDIHPDDIADTQKKIAEAGRSTFSEYAKRMARLKLMECEGARIFGDDVINWLESNGFFAAPASTRYHGSYAGGLFEHSYQVGFHLQELTEKLGLKWQRPISPWIIGIFHDLCKIDSYRFNQQERKFEYDNSSILKGHGMKSLVYALQICDLTPEEQACIAYHMGAFTPEKEWQDYTNAIHRYPNVLYTHTADMMASHIDLT